MPRRLKVLTGSCLSVVVVIGVCVCELKSCSQVQTSNHEKVLKSINEWSGLWWIAYSGLPIQYWASQGGSLPKWWSCRVSRWRCLTDSGKNCRTRSSATRRQSIGWQPLIGSWPTPPLPPLVSPDCVGVAEVRTALMPVALPRVRPARAQSTFAPMTVENRTRTRSVGCSHPRSPVFHLSISCISINRMSINYLVLSWTGEITHTLVWCSD